MFYSVLIGKIKYAYIPSNCIDYIDLCKKFSFKVTNDYILPTTKSFLNGQVSYLKKGKLDNI